MNSSTQYGAGTFMFDYNGGYYGGQYHTENGKVVSVALSSLAQAGNGGWLSTSQTVVTVFGEAQASESKNSTLDLLGAIGRFIGSTDFVMGATDLTLGKWVSERGANILNGTGRLHPSFMNLADKNFMYANRFMSGTRTLQVMKFAKVAGPVASIAGIGLSGYKILSGKGDVMDGVDIGVNLVGLGATYAIGAGILMASNPIGWIIGAGVLIYNGVRLYQEFSKN
jgi:hypothetical protein